MKLEPNAREDEVSALNAGALLERIEKRRFVGREFLLWLWFESEIFEGTLATKEHGEFGLWIEKQFVVSEGREITRIRGSTPAGSREAKESLHRGKMPEIAGIHVSREGKDSSFALRAERMAFAGLSLPAVLGKEEAPALLEAKPPPRKKKSRREDDERAESDEAHESFYERMHLTKDVEGLIEALYRDFLVLRLGPAWEALVVPAIRTWMEKGGEVDVDAYRAARLGVIMVRR
jgi:hypothetical protein